MAWQQDTEVKGEGEQKAHYSVLSDSIHFIFSGVYTAEIKSTVLRRRKTVHFIKLLISFSPWLAFMVLSGPDLHKTQIAIKGVANESEAQGDGVCNFRYKLGRPVTQGWDSEIPSIRKQLAVIIEKS